MKKTALLLFAALSISVTANAAYDPIYDYRSPLYYNSASASVSLKDKTMPGIEGSNNNLKGVELGFSMSPDFDAIYGNIGRYTKDDANKETKSIAISLGIQHNILYIDRWYVLAKAALGYQQFTSQDRNYKINANNPVDLKIDYDSAIVPLSIEIGRPITRHVDGFLGVGGEVGYITKSTAACSGNDATAQASCAEAVDKSSDIDKGKITTGLGASAGLKFNF